MDSIFNQKAPRAATETYYFQLSPTLLTIKNQSIIKSQKSSSSQFRLKIMKGNQLSDEMKKSIGVKAINGRAAFDKVQMNFSLPSFNPNRNIEFVLILLKSEEGQDEVEVGKHIIKSGDFVLDFKQNKNKVHEINVDLGDDYALEFVLYIDNSRFSLEKFIKDRKEEQKEGNIEKLLSSKQITPTLNQARSEMQSDSEKFVLPGEDRFMSPSRRISRKQSGETRKLLQRGNSSPDNSQDGSANRGLKFLSRNSQKEEVPVASSFAEEESKRVSDKMREEEEKRKEETRKKEAEVEKKRVEAQKAEERKIEAERKRMEDKEKREQEEIARKNEETKKIAEEKRLETQRKREEQRKKEEHEKNLLIESRKVQKSRSIESSENQLSSSRKNDNISPIKSIQKDIHASPSILDESDLKITGLRDSKPVQRRGSIKVTVKTEDQNETSSFEFLTGSVEKWSRPVVMKKTDSAIYDNKGQEVRKSTLSSKNQVEVKDTKSKLLTLGFFVLSLFIILFVMKPNRKV